MKYGKLKLRDLAEATESTNEHIPTCPNKCVMNYKAEAAEKRNEWVQDLQQ